VPQDARFLTNALRVRNADQLAPLLATALAARRVQEWLPLLERAKVACAPINDIGQVFSDPQVVARGMRVDLPHPLAGTIPSIANPIRFSATPVEYHRGPPVLGEHSAEVLEDVLGLSAAQIAELRAGGALG